jgi:uncharacterized membrane protein
MAADDSVDRSRLGGQSPAVGESSVGAMAPRRIRPEVVRPFPPPPRPGAGTRLPRGAIANAWLPRTNRDRVGDQPVRDDPTVPVGSGESLGAGVDADIIGGHNTFERGPSAVWKPVIGVIVLLSVMAATWVSAPPVVVPGTVGAVDDLSIDSAEGHIESTEIDPPGAPGGSRHQVRVTSGRHSGALATVTLQAPSIPMRAGTAPSYEPGDRVVLMYRAEDSSVDGSAAVEPFQIVDRVRRPWLWAGITLIAVIAGAVSGWQGLRAMAGLGVAAWMIWWLVVPRILAGQDPVVVAVVGCVAIAVPALVLTHGFSREAAVPLAGMAGSLALAGGVSIVAVRAASLTGLASNEEIHLVHAALRGEIDTRGLLLAGMLLGAVGGLIDVTIAQSAAVFALASTGYVRSRSELFWRGMAVGRAHVVAAVHTLVLAYAGAALPTLLLLALYAPQLGDIWNREIIAAELLRAVTGIVGLGAAMPLTTWIAAQTARIGETTRA